MMNYECWRKHYGYSDDHEARLDYDRYRQALATLTSLNDKAEHVEERDGGRHYVQTADGYRRWHLKVVETAHGFGVRVLIYSGHGARSDLKRSRLLCRDVTETEARRCARREATAIRRWLDQQ